MALKKNPKCDLKMQYNVVLKTSLIFSLLLLITAFNYFPDLRSGETIKVKPQDVFEGEVVNPTNQNPQPPEPPKPLIPIETLDDKELENVEITSTELDINEDMPETLTQPGEQCDEEEIIPDFFVAVEQGPEPVGGIQAILEKLKYPPFAQRAGIQGKVYITAYVNENGDVEKVELAKGIGGGCDEEAMQAVKETKFYPGKQRGKAVKVKITVPVLFKLQ